MLLKDNHSPGSVGGTADEILGHYLRFLKTTQGLADATLVLRRLHVKPFLLSLENSGVLADLRRLAPSTVHDYIIALRERQQSFLISMDQALTALFKSSLFSAQLLFPFAERIGIPRGFLSPVDFALHQRGIVQQTNDLLPYEFIQSILTKGAVGAYRTFQSTVAIRSEAAVIMQFPFAGSRRCPIQSIAAHIKLAEPTASVMVRDAQNKMDWTNPLCGISIARSYTERRFAVSALFRSVLGRLRFAKALSGCLQHIPFRKRSLLCHPFGNA